MYDNINLSHILTYSTVQTYDSFSVFGGKREQVVFTRVPTCAARIHLPEHHFVTSELSPLKCRLREKAIVCIEFLFYNFYNFYLHLTLPCNISSPCSLTSLHITQTYRWISRSLHSNVMLIFGIYTVTWVKQTYTLIKKHKNTLPSFRRLFKYCFSQRTYSMASLLHLRVRWRWGESGNKICGQENCQTV